MSKVVAFVGQKGGVGKSALARLLAVEALRAGKTARIMDLDPGQGTTTEWSLARDRAEIDPEVPVEKCRTVEAALRRRGETDVLILDGRAFADQLTRQMGLAADLIVMPTCLGRDDMRPQIRTAYELEEAGVPTERMTLTFCRISEEGAETAAARRYIATSNLPMTKGFLREKPSIRQAMNVGRAASETGFASVDAEAQRLGAELLGLIGY